MGLPYLKNGTWNGKKRCPSLRAELTLLQSDNFRVSFQVIPENSIKTSRFKANWQILTFLKFIRAA